MIQQGKYIHGTTSRWQSFVVTFSCNYLLPIKIGLGRCQTIANLYLCIWPWCSHLYWCHEEWIPRWVIIPTFNRPHGLKVRGWKVSLVLLFIHNFFVSVVKIRMDTKIGQHDEATTHQWMINIEVAAVQCMFHWSFLDAHWVFYLPQWGASRDQGFASDRGLRL